MAKYVDIPSIVQVIGAIYNNPSLLDETDKYHFYEEDFPEEFHQIIFGSIYNLHMLGVKEININTIEDYLEQRPEKYAVYKVNKGADYLKNLSQTTQIAAFDYYYNRMKKMTLLRMYDDIGVNLSWLYDTNNIMDVKKKQAQEDWLDNTSLEDIADIIDKRITDIRSKYVDNSTNEIENAGNNALELLENLRKVPEVGYPLYGPLINTVCRGARLKKFYLRSASTGVGKAIPNETILPTPNGYKKVADIREGDLLFGQDGRPTKVLRVYPQKEKKKIWKITFSDGRIAKCCKDHLWTYSYAGHNEKLWRTESTEELYHRTLSLKNGLKDSNNKGYRFKIPLNKAVEYSEKQYSVSPYAMGLLLGNGSFRYSQSNKELLFSSETDELPKSLAIELGNCVCHKNSDFNYNYSFKPTSDSSHNLWVEEILSEYPDLWQTKSETKFIPDDYLLGSVSQRKSLLQGLLDTDGSIDKKGRISYFTVSPYLRDNVIELCHSLGYITSVLVDQRTKKYTTGECYKITIQCKKQEKPQLFRLTRKKNIAIQYSNNNKRSEYKDSLAIVNIEETNEESDMTCFTVDNTSHLFLMNDFIVTHNTRSMIADVCFIACDKIYNSDTGKWEANGTCEPTFFISTEQELEELQTMMIAFLSDVDEDHILNGEYTEGEWERVCEAAKILQRSPLYIQELPDFSLQDIENTIKNGVIEYNTKYVFLDYIHSSMKILNEVSSRSGIKGLREDNVLFMISIRLKDLCNEYGIFIMSATQLNADYRTAKQYDQNLLRGAKSIGDKIDTGMIMLETSQDDLVALDNVLTEGGFPRPDIKISIYKNRRGRYKDILLWCTANRGTCKIKPMFATNYNYELIELNDLQININPNIESSAF